MTIDSRGKLIEPVQTNNSGPARATFRWIPLVMVATSLVLAWLGWIFLAPKPVLNEAEFYRLAGAARFDEADSLLRDHLRGSPDDVRSLFLLAELLLERPDRDQPGARIDDAAEALEFLDKLQDLPVGKPPDSPATRMLYRGKARRTLKQWDRAEHAWKEALRLNPRIPEAGLALLDLYYVESRRREARELALTLFENEPDPQDRTLILTSLLFLDAVKPDAKSLEPIFEAVTRADPEGVHAHLALGLALVRAGEIDRGLEILNAQVGRTESAEMETRVAAAEGLLLGLEAGARTDELSKFFKDLPDDIRNRNELARFRGLEAQQREDWPTAIIADREALAFDPTDFETKVRLSRALRFTGQVAEADAIDSNIASEREVAAGLVSLHDELSRNASLGLKPRSELCERIASTYEALSRAAEAEAWRRIASDSAKAL